MNFEEAVREHDDLEAALDIHDYRVLSKDSKAGRLKKLVAQTLLDAMNIDREKGTIMVDSYRQKWFAVCEHRDTEELTNLDEYFAFRRGNVGCE